MESFSCKLTNEVEQIKMVNERKNKLLKRKEMLLEMFFVSMLFTFLYFLGNLFI